MCLWKYLTAVFVPCASVNIGMICYGLVIGLGLWLRIMYRVRIMIMVRVSVSIG